MNIGTPSPSSRKRTPSFKLEFTGSPEIRDECQQKIKRMKTILHEEKLNNTEVLRRSLDFFITSNEENGQQKKQHDGQFHNTYLRAEISNTDQPLFLTSADSFQNLIMTTESHSRICQAPLLISDKTVRGAVTILRLQCDHGHVYNISSSPYLPNGKFLCNFRLMHAYICSGMLPSQFGSFCENLGFSSELSKPETNSMFPLFVNATKEEKSISCETAIREEVGLSVDDDGEIGIMTDARHGWRRNANDTNVVCIGNKTHKVLTDEHVTKRDDPVAQRHELLGTKRMYQHFDSDLDCVGGPVRIKSHAHDRNASVNKFIREERTDTLNQNDTWHAAKSVQKEIARVAKGPLYREGKSWHRELSDKVNSIRTHVQYSMRTCEGNPDAIRSSLDNVVSHYKNEHDKCNPLSRCKTDPNYEPSKLIIRSPEAEKMLRAAIRNTCVYKNAEDYVLSMDTYYVESFNNVLNVFLDKRIVFSSQIYRLRTDLAVLQWNENVDRPYTSIWSDENDKKKKLYRPKTTKFQERIWARVMSDIY